ncbi:TRAP transporter small permease [Terrihabitans rhizophilus]|jgi:TRAP-type C4-dicarboxylate transport system permease small subunit|uniref:TRAP transporter small permease protein n=1 Tax=Terrihabitans rhizophilus TaxID=3092662 RepID=A0ABU4RR78_9HYPH|nr:TRAP transporter small permease [Terrihabitans sp. PJ23]MDX6806185.1 TRAP transporter small permease [Terrihabitans sp. PJ23]
MKTFYRYMIGAEAVLAGTFLLIMVAVIFGGGVARMMHYPLNWTGEVATGCFAWACFLCADIAWRNNTLMSLDLIVDLFPPSVRRAIVYFNLFVIACFLCYAIYAGGWLAWISRSRSFQGITGVSYSWVTASLPVGAALMLITTVLKIRTAMQDHRVVHTAEEGVPSAW